MKYLIPFLLLFFIACSSQEVIFQKKPLSFYKEIEKRKQSIEKGFFKFNLWKDPFSNDVINETNYPLIYERKSRFKPNLHTWYFYDKDSIIKGIWYNWGLYNPVFNPKKNIKYLNDLTQNQKEFQVKFNDIKREISLKYGNPIFDEEIKNNSQRIIRKVKWEKDMLIIKLTMVFTKVILEDPVIGIDAQFNVRLEGYFN